MKYLPNDYHFKLTLGSDSFVQFNISNMKDRWKILVASIVIGAVLGIILLFIGFSFKYGIVQYTFFRSVDPSQTVRSNGNYLIGLANAVIPYPKGLLSHQISVNVLTKDKSLITMDGLFLGKLISSEILNMHFNYGSQYFSLVTYTVQETFRQALQQFMLKQLITQRNSINNFVSSKVCMQVQTQYSFISCQYAATGKMHINARPVILSPQTSVQTLYKRILRSTMEAQKKMNVYSSGGLDVINKLENANAELFLNTTRLIVDVVAPFTNQSSQIFAGAAYVLNNPLMPVLSNQIRAFDGNQ